MVQFTKSKDLFVTPFIILSIGGIYTGIQLLLPNRGLTGHYLHLSEGGPKAQTHLGQGWIPIQINYVNADRYAKLNLQWQRPGDSKFANISSWYLKPSEDIRIFGRARLWWAIGFISNLYPLVLVSFLCWGKKQ